MVEDQRPQLLYPSFQKPISTLADPHPRSNQISSLISPSLFLLSRKSCYLFG
uniref:Uncharacterized protein n=1 Tax=Vitis vinifera TaxID=29760 RepID=F6HUZ7_VITVI